MNQQSQAQSQAQTPQAQLAALREQNAILNQQLNSQAQSHIQHLQQLIPFHQPPQPVQAPSIPPTPQPSGPQAPEPPTPVATPTTQSGPTPSFNHEMFQQMKHTVESSLQALVEKTQERQANQPPAHPPVPTLPPNLSQHPPLVEQPPPRQRSSRRSRSHHHHSSSRRHDKRPVSIPRSPRRRRSHRRSRRSSRSRSPSRDISTHRHESRQPGRGTSITLRSASPSHREERHRDHDHQQPREKSRQTATLQAAQWGHNPQPSSYTDPQTRSYHHEHSSTDKWQSWGQWKDYSKHSGSSNTSKWVDYSQPSDSHHTPHDSSTKPLTAFSSNHTTPSLRHKQKKPPTPGESQPPTLVNVHPGHMVISLQEGSKEEWIRGVKFALRHPDRMPAASEVAPETKPQPLQTIDIKEFDRAAETLKQVDTRIPSDVIQKAVQLLFSTYLLPDYDLWKSYIIELPSTNMLALIFPLPDSSHFQMPPPFRKHQNPHLGTPPRNDPPDLTSHHP